MFYYLEYAQNFHVGLRLYYAIRHIMVFEEAADAARRTATTGYKHFTGLRLGTLLVDAPLGRCAGGFDLIFCKQFEVAPIPG